MVTIIAPAIGIAVRFTRSKGDTPPMPEETTITAVIVITYVNKDLCFLSGNILSC